MQGTGLACHAGRLILVGSTAGDGRRSKRTVRRLRNRIPRWAVGQLRAEQFRMGPSRFASDTISVLDETADFQVGETIKIGADARYLPLDFGMQGGWILSRIDN